MSDAGARLDTRFIIAGSLAILIAAFGAMKWRGYRDRKVKGIGVTLVEQDRWSTLNLAQDPSCSFDASVFHSCQVK